MSHNFSTRVDSVVRDSNEPQTSDLNIAPAPPRNGTTDVGNTRARPANGGQNGDTSPVRVVYTLAQQRRATLHGVDKAGFRQVHIYASSLMSYSPPCYSRFHAKVCLVAGVGFFTDAYGVSPILMLPSPTDLDSSLQTFLPLVSLAPCSATCTVMYRVSPHFQLPSFISSFNPFLALSNTPHIGMSLSQSQDMGLKIASPVGTLVGQLVFGWLADIVGRKRMCMHPIPYFTTCTPTSRTPPLRRRGTCHYNRYHRRSGNRWPRAWRQHHWRPHRPSLLPRCRNWG